MVKEEAEKEEEGRRRMRSMGRKRRRRRRRRREGGGEQRANTHPSQTPSFNYRVSFISCLIIAYYPYKQRIGHPVNIYKNPSANTSSSVHSLSNNQWIE